MMDDRGKSDNPIVPKKPSNKVGQPTTERVEGRGLAKGNPSGHDMRRAQHRASMPSGLERIRQAAKKDRKQQFTTLLHHVYDVERLRAAHREMERNAAAGIDGETWQHYGENLEENLRGLSERLRRGGYQAKPVRRVYIAKADGRLRPLGVPVLEDKIVQRATAEVLSAIYEQDFVGFSYGFRPGRSQHRALDAVSVGICRRKVGYVLDMDIRGFYDTLNHEWLVKFVEHRIGDRRIVRLVKKWLAAGVLEDGKRIQSEVGTVQGGSISPLLANIYLHYVFDQWVQNWRRKQARGDVIVVRYADDAVVGFQYRAEAERFVAELRQRLAKFGLELHPDKTRLIEFGRFAASNRSRRGAGKPETFNFLGFTHISGKSHKGGYTVLRQTIRPRMCAKLHEVKETLRQRMHAPIPETGSWLASVIRGHFQYYGVPGNQRALMTFRRAITRTWRQVLLRRSQTAHVPWPRMNRLVTRWFPPVRLHHPYPSQRLVV